MKEPIRILHLEDVRTDAELVERELRKGPVSFERVWVTNKQDFQKALKGFCPEIVLCDHNLPSFTSAQALTMLKDEGLNVPFILLTGAMTDEYAAEIMRQGASDYVLKDRISCLSEVVTNALMKHRSGSQVDADPAAGSNNRIRILLLEHIPSDAELVRTQLENSNLHSELVIVDNRDDYERALKQHSPDLVLSDFAMPDFNAFQAVKIAREQCGDIPFIFITSAMSGELAVQIIRAGAHDYVLKSNLQRLPVAVRNALEIMSLERVKKDSLNKIKTGEEKYRQIVETAQEGIWMIDENNNTSFVNRKICDILGYTPEEMMGKVVFDFMDDEGKKLALIAIEDQKQHLRETTEFQFITKSGKPIWTNITSNPIFGEGKKYNGALAMVTDITDRKMAEVERERMIADIIQRNKDLEQFTYIVSHNLRAPTANIVGISNALLHPNLKEEHRSMLLKGLSDSVKVLDGVIIDLNNILQVKRDVNEHKKLMRFSELVSDIEASLAGLIEKAGVRIICDFTEIDEIRSIKSYLNSIFYNLVSNSIKYRQPAVAPLIEIKSYAEQNRIRILFKDNGLGIDLQRQGEQVFGLYKRFHVDISEGKGVGLFMVKTQVESLGGKIRIRSEVNKGTEFEIELPNEHD